MLEHREDAKLHHRKQLKCPHAGFGLYRHSLFQPNVQDSWASSKIRRMKSTRPETAQESFSISNVQRTSGRRSFDRADGRRSETITPGNFIFRVRDRSRWNSSSSVSPALNSAGLTTGASFHSTSFIHSASRRKPQTL